MLNSTTKLSLSFQDNIELAWSECIIKKICFYLFMTSAVTYRSRKEISSCLRRRSTKTGITASLGTNMGSFQRLTFKSSHLFPLIYLRRKRSSIFLSMNETRKIAWNSKRYAFSSPGAFCTDYNPLDGLCGLNCIFQGDILTVIRRVDENWVEGKIEDKIGIFPITFVEVRISFF